LNRLNPPPPNYHRLEYKLRIEQKRNGNCIMHCRYGTDQSGQLSRCPASPCYARVTTELNLQISVVTTCRGSSVGIATGYGLDDCGVGVRVPVGSRIFSMSSRPALGFTQPPIQLVPGVKRPGREAYHSPPASAEVKKMWIYTFTLPYAFMA
jgi:hypothetical protein